MHFDDMSHTSAQKHIGSSHAVRRMLTISILGLMLLPLGCTTTGAAQQTPLAEQLKSQLRQMKRAPAAPSQRAELIFAQLKLDKALLSDDADGIIDAAGRLLRFSHGEHKLTASASIIDAAIWLLAHEMEEDAIPLVQQASSLLPDDLPLTALHADLLIQQNERDEAITLLKAFAAKHSSNVQAQAELALAQLRSGQAEEAMVVFDGIPEKELTPIIRFAYAQALNSVRRFGDADAQLTAAVKEEPEYAEAWQLLALTKEELGQKNEAMAIYQDLLKMDPENRSARLFLIRRHLADGNMETAASRIAEASDPLHFSVAAAAMLMDEQDFEKAELLLKTLEGRPAMPEGLYFYHAALLYENNSDLGQALHLLEKVTAQSPEYDKALRMKMRILYDQKKNSEALVAAEELCKLHPQDVEPLLLMAELHTSLGRLDDADKTLGEALALQPDNEGALTQFAYLRELQGRRPEAMALMEKVIAEYPNNAFALNYVGYNLAESGIDLDRALALVRQAVELEPQADFIIDSLAWTLFKRGEYAEAWTEIQKAVDLSDKNASYDPTMLEHYGDIATAAGRMKEAAEAWKLSLSIFERLNMPADAERVRKKLEK